MRALLAVIGAFVIITTSKTANAQVLYLDDFEAGASGWSDNKTETDPDTTRFLGRFAVSNKETYRTFTVPPRTDKVTITFDFIRMDSWDDTAQYGFDRFEVEIDDVEIFSAPPFVPSLSGATGNVTWSLTDVGPYVDFVGNANWPDRIVRVSIVVDNPGPTLKLKLRADLTQGVDDESAGYDNFRVEAVPLQPNVTLNKVRLNAGTGSGFDIPGEEVIYRLDLRSSGVELDASTLNLVDLLPPNIELFTGDFDGAGNPVQFTDLSGTPAGITCCAGGGVSFSRDAGANPPFNYTPNGTYDGNVTGFRIVPNGGFRRGKNNPIHVRFEVKARIK
jgi:hypothetical protein